MKKYLFLSFILVLSSCISIPDENKKMTEFIIENKSSSPIKNIICTTSSGLSSSQLQVFDQINSGEKSSGFISSSVHTFEGEYILKFTRTNGKSEQIGYGYYDGTFFYYSYIKFEIHDDSQNNIISGIADSVKCDFKY